MFLVDASTGELRSRVADLPELTEIRLPPGRGVARAEALVTLKAVCGPDDAGSPCLTVMRPDEE